MVLAHHAILNVSASEHLGQAAIGLCKMTITSLLSTCYYIKGDDGYVKQ